MKKRKREYLQPYRTANSVRNEVTMSRYLWHVYIRWDVWCREIAFALVNTSLDNDDADTMTRLKRKRKCATTIQFEIEFIVLWLLAHGF